MKNENKFQPDMIEAIELEFPGCIILKNDPNYIQGIPDLTVLYKNKWATLECKRSINEPHRPNQDYYVNLMNRMSYSSFVYPENKEKVLHDLQCAFRTRR